MPEPEPVEHNDSGLADVGLAQVLTDIALAGLAALAYFGTVDLRSGREDTDD